MSHPWKTKWAQRPTPELVARLIDLTGTVMGFVDEDNDPPRVTEVMDGHDEIRRLTSETHWISEELEHRIRKSQHAGLWDIEIVFLP